MNFLKAKKLYFFHYRGHSHQRVHQRICHVTTNWQKNLKNLGVDDILCVSVNDTFVMNAWADDQECENVKVIPDGNGEFTKAMGRLVEKDNLGFGARSWRYSMLVDDGKIVKIFDEPEKDGDPLKYQTLIP